MSRLFLPKASFAQIKACNELFSGSAAAMFSVQGVQYSIVFEANPTIQSWWCVIDGVIGTEEVELFLDTPPPLETILPGIYPEEHLALPETVLLVALDALLEGALDSLSIALGSAISITNIERKPKHSKHMLETLFFSIIDVQRSIRTLCALRFTSGKFSDSFASRLLPIMREASIQKGASYVIPVPCKLQIGYTTLPYSTIHDIEPKDIVFFDEYYPYTGHIVLRTQDDAFFRASWYNGTVTIGEEIANDDDEGAYMSGSNMADMPVKITMDLGNVLLPMGDVKKLSNGYVFTTEQSTASPVTLRIHGKRFAIGELLDVEGRIGVRIVDIVLGKAEEVQSVEYTAPDTGITEYVDIAPTEAMYKEEDFY